MLVSFRLVSNSTLYCQYQWHVLFRHSSDAWVRYNDASFKDVWRISCVTDIVLRRSAVCYGCRCRSSGPLIADVVTSLHLRSNDISYYCRTVRYSPNFVVAVPWRKDMREVGWSRQKIIHFDAFVYLRFRSTGSCRILSARRFFSSHALHWASTFKGIPIIDWK